jgi:hypothetical protein
MKQISRKVAQMYLAAGIAVFASASAFGAADTLFTAGVTKLTTILTGTGGILVTLVAIVAAVVAGATGNIKTALTALGVAIIASVGPTVATSFFTAVL